MVAPRPRSALAMHVTQRDDAVVPRDVHSDDDSEEDGAVGEDESDDDKADAGGPSGADTSPATSPASAESDPTPLFPDDPAARSPTYPPTIRSLNVRSASLSVLQPSAADVPRDPYGETTFAEFVRGELLNDELDDLDRVKVERLTNILQVPLEFEQFIVYGSLVCLDVFLALFVLLPVRVCIALGGLGARALGLSRRLRTVHKSDLLKGSLFVVSCVALLPVDSSLVYHAIRGQTTLKLYVIYNVLEVVDRLCTAFGQDVMDSLFSNATLTAQRPHALLQPLPHAVLALLYLVVHSLVMLLQLITLNVAINSFSASLLTVLLSSQFAEIKSNVFKKMSKENLWQVACSDLVERFQLGVFLVLITVRNWSDMGESFDADYVLGNFLPQVLALFFSEVLIDWLKHAFITKFNRIPPSTYGTYVDIACRDLVVQRSPTPGSYDQTPLVARRLGFAAMPLACVTVRVLLELAEALDVRLTAWWAAALALLGFVCLFLAKLIVGVTVLGTASRRCLHSDVFNASLYSSKYAFADDLVDRFSQR